MVEVLGSICISVFWVEGCSRFRYMKEVVDRSGIGLCYPCQTRFFEEDSSDSPGSFQNIYILLPLSYTTASSLVENLE